MESLRKFNLVFYILFFLSPNLYSQGLEKGIELYNKKQYLESEKIFTELITKNKRKEIPLFYLAKINFNLKKWDKCISYIKKVLELNNKNAEYHFLYGSALGNKIKENKLSSIWLISKLKRAFKTAAAIDTKHEDVRIALVKTYLQLPKIMGGSIETSKKYASELIKINKIKGLHSYTEIHKKTKNYSSLEKNYIEIINTSNNLSTYNNLFNLYYEELLNPEKAILIAEKAISNKENALYFHYYIGKVCSKFELDFQKGIDHLLYFLKNYKSSKIGLEWVYYRLGQLYYYQGELNKSSYYLELSLNINKNFKEALTFKSMLK